MREPEYEEDLRQRAEEGLARLADSLRKFGQIQPVVVRPRLPGGRAPLPRQRPCRPPRGRARRPVTSC